MQKRVACVHHLICLECEADCQSTCWRISSDQAVHIYILIAEMSSVQYLAADRI